jgi:histone H3/H4
MELVIRSKVRELTGEMSVSKDFCDALDTELEHIIQKAIARAKANNRNTVMARDV